MDFCIDICEDINPKELQDRFTLWSLRIIFKLGVKQEFLDYQNYFHNEYLAAFLGLEQNVENNNNFNRSDLFKDLEKKLQKLERKKELHSSKLLQKNIKNLAKLMQLNSVFEIFRAYLDEKFGWLF